tara:strand:+ start:7708 stop:8154 length:447 start_codon:yes stop_codon:yes gene_type:complete
MQIEIKMDADKSLARANWSFIAKLHDDFFGSGADKFQRRFEEKPELVSHLAFLGNELIGFKMAYPQSPDCLYSWMGGVTPEHRRSGVALKLMQAQHEWANAEGYQRIITKSTNHFVPMILLNLKSGFIITGTEEDKGRLKVVMEKNLI